MPESNPVKRDFFARPALQVARDLLGMRLVRLDDGRRLAGIIVEAEAYCGEDDLGCHARAGRTPRTSVMYEQPGHAYVYFTYGMHWMLNFVTEISGVPAAVLIRAITPTEGLDVIAARRDGQPSPRWTDGPAKLCQALGIDGRHNGIDICIQEAEIFIESDTNWDPVPDSCVITGPRVGLNNVPEPWKTIPWRFLAQLDITPTAQSIEALME